jgi:hypothetical protein
MQYQIKPPNNSAWITRPTQSKSRSAANRDFDSTHLNFEFPFWMESSQTDFGKVVRRKWANLPFHVETASTAAS